MSADLTKTLRGAIDGLSMFDVAKLEQTCSDAEAMLGMAGVQSTPEARALRHTLRELLASTDANLRLLRELQTLRARGRCSYDNTGLNRGDRWVR